MSWLTGNDYTSFWVDLQSVGHNALTGELTDSQKAQIAQGTADLLLNCQNDPTIPECVKLQSENTTIVNQVAPSTKCAIRLPVYGCVESWGNLLAVAVVLIVVVLALYGYLVFNPRRL